VAWDSNEERLADVENRLGRLEDSLAEIQRLLAVEAAAAEPEPPRVEEPEPARPLAPKPRPPDAPPLPVAQEPPPPPEFVETWRERTWDFERADLVGARALAWAGGIVTLLGVVLFFALAVNRGWLGAEARVVLGAVAAGLVLAGGLFLRHRFGETYASLAAVGAGIAGWYACLLAAGPHYDLLSDWTALGLAAGVAAAALGIALYWSSEFVAGLGLVGAMAVQIPISWGDGLTVSGTGFTALMFTAAAVVVVVRQWPALLLASAIAVVPQVIVLAVGHAGDGTPGAIVSAVGCSAVLLAAAIGLQLRSKEELDGFPASVALGAAVLASVSLAVLVARSQAEGAALLGVAGVYGCLAAAFYFRPGRRDLSALLGAIGLAVAAVAVADLLSGTSLAIAWSAESAVLVWLAWRIRDLRYQAASLGYLVIAIGHALVIDAPPRHLFVDVPDPTAGIGAIVAATVALGVFAERCRHEVAKSSHWQPFIDAQTNLRLVTGVGAGVGAMYAASLGLLELPGSFAWDHVAVTGLLAVVPLGALAFGLARRSLRVELGAAIGVGLAVVKVIAFDVPQLGAPQRSWGLVIAASALFVGGVAFASFTPGLEELEPVSSIALVASAPLVVVGLFDLLDGRWHGISRTGAALLVPTAVYALTSVALYRRRVFLDYSTLLWVEAGAIGVIATGLLLAGTPLALAWAGASVLLAVLSRASGDFRLQVGAALYLVLAIGHGLILDSPPTDFFESNRHPASGAGAVAGAAVAALTLALVLRIPARLLPEGRRITRTPLYALAGALATYAVSLVVLELFELEGGRIETRFERGHVAVSAFWGVLALLLLYLGLTRRLSLRLAGFVLFGVTLAKIFLYDLGTLNPVARALSFLAVGAVLLLGGFFYQRYSAEAADRNSVAGG
jgi:uncharacterized membrane protein